MKPRTLLLCLALLLAAPGLARAGDEGYARRGVFVGFHTIYSGELFESEIEDSLPGIDVSVDSSSGINVRLGYRVFPWLALETHGELYNNYNIELLGVDAAELDGFSITMMGKLYPLTGRIQPYFIGGMGYYEVDLADQLSLGLSLNSRGSVVRGGAGIDIYLTQHFVLNLESSYSFPMGGVSDLDFWTVGAGVEYRF